MTAEEFKDAFQRNGSLAPIMDTFAHNLRISHADWFDLANDTGECLQAIAVKAMDERRGKIGDKNVLSPLLLLPAGAAVAIGTSNGSFLPHSDDQMVRFCNGPF